MANYYLDFFNLTNSANRKIKELSKGNQQKVQIISTIVHELELVILDEPFSGFDPINGALLQDLVGKMNEAGTPVILSSHNMHAVEEMCQSIALIDKGHLLLSGKIEDIKEENKSNELLLTVSSMLPIHEFKGSNILSEISPDVVTKGRKGFAYRLKKAEGVKNNEVLAEIARCGDILHFEEALPSLNELFIKYTTKKEE